MTADEPISASVLSQPSNVTTPSAQILVVRRSVTEYPIGNSGLFLKGATVTLHRTALFLLLVMLLTPAVGMAQGFGEYGRSLGGATQRQSGVNSGTRGGLSQSGKGVYQGVGDLGGRPIPSRLVVASKAAMLYPRQDDQAEKIASLAEGEVLFPLVQSEGGNDWYMVKTTQGLVGWVKSSDVR